MIALVWQFDVKAGQERGIRGVLRRRRRVDGARPAEPIVSGRSFLRDLAMGHRYLVIEYWSEMVVYEKHHADFQDETERLEKQRDALVEVAQPLGLFNALDVPDRDGPTWSQRSGRSELNCETPDRSQERTTRSQGQEKRPRAFWD